MDVEEAHGDADDDREPLHHRLNYGVRRPASPRGTRRGEPELGVVRGPGALDVGMVEEYVRRRNGTRKVSSPLPEIEEILRKAGISDKELDAMDKTNPAVLLGLQ